MADIVEKPRKNNQIPANFKKKFEGTSMEENLPCIDAIYRVVKRVQDKKIQNDLELRCFIKSDYWDVPGIFRVLRAFLQGRFSFDYENFQIVSYGLKNSETPTRATRCKTDNELILGIIREDSRVDHGPKLTTFLEAEFRNIKSILQEDYPFELPNAVVYSWIFECGVKRIYENLRTKEQ